MIRKQTDMSRYGCVLTKLYFKKIGADTTLLTPDLEFTAIYRLAVQIMVLANDNDDECKK